jgi:hypothetical protein
VVITGLPSSPSAFAEWQHTTTRDALGGYEVEEIFIDMLCAIGADGPEPVSTPATDEHQSNGHNLIYPSMR